MENSAADIDDDHQKSPAEKMRVRLAAEGYDGRYKPMDDYTDEEQSGEKKKKANWYRTCSPFIILISIGLIVVSGFAILAAFLKMRLDSYSQVCQTTDCMITSGIILSKMDTAVQPCTDFYAYSCSAFTTNVNIPPDKVMYSTLGGDMDSSKKPRMRKLLEESGAEYLGENSTAVAKARQFYSVCMNISAVETLGNAPLLNLINSLGSWSVTPAAGTWDVSSWSIESSVADANLYSIYPFFSTHVGTDDKNSSVNMIVMDQDGLSLFDYKSYIGNSSETFHQAYINFFVSVAKLLGGGNNVQSLAEDVWKLEKEIAGIFLPPDEREDVYKMYNLKTVADIQTYFGNIFDVDAFLTRVYGSRLSRSQLIIVRVPEYFRKLGKILTAAPSETIANYIAWLAVCNMVSYMPTPYRLAALQLKMAVYGVSAETQRWEFCTNHAEEALGFATGALYIDKYFSEPDRLKVESVLNLVWSEFKLNLAHNTWMDEATKLTAIDKANALLYKVGYPEFVKNVLELDKYYAQLTATDSSFQNELNGIKFSVMKNRAKLGQPTDKSEWSMSPAQINAYYDPSLNQIVIPAGILQRPLYDKSFPGSLIFGAIGYVIGHEITHGFDNTGRQYDKYGNMVDWWGNSSAQQFNSLTQCFIDEYNAFEVYGSHINGISTQGENIADNGGIRISYMAYQKWLASQGNRDLLLPGLNMTYDQQFFLSFAQTWCAYYRPQYAIQLLVTDPHSNAKYRVNGVVRNMEEFSQAFACTKTAPLNPENKCRLW